MIMRDEAFKANTIPIINQIEYKNRDRTTEITYAKSGTSDGLHEWSDRSLRKCHISKLTLLIRSYIYFVTDPMLIIYCNNKIR